MIKFDAGVAELADAQDLKSCGLNRPYRFDSGRRHSLWETLYSILRTRFFCYLNILKGSFACKKS